jgi:hypothetical protein
MQSGAESAATFTVVICISNLTTQLHIIYIDKSLLICDIKKQSVRRLLSNEVFHKIKESVEVQLS